MAPFNRSLAYEFQLAFHGNHGPILCRFRGKARSKIAIYIQPNMRVLKDDKTHLGQQQQ